MKWHDNRDDNSEVICLGLKTVGTCEPWVAWVGANATLHAVWVATLLGCQLYQVRHSSGKNV